MILALRFIGRMCFAVTFAVLMSHLSGGSEIADRMGLSGVAFLGAWYVGSAVDAVLRIHDLIMDRLKRLEGKGPGEAL